MRTQIEISSRFNLTGERQRQLLSLFDHVKMERMLSYKEARQQTKALTPQQRMILTGVWAGMSNEKITKWLGLKSDSKSFATVRGHIATLLKKTGKTNRVELAVLFERCLHRTHGKLSPW